MRREWSGLTLAMVTLACTVACVLAAARAAVAADEAKIVGTVYDCGRPLANGSVCIRNYSDDEGHKDLGSSLEQEEAGSPYFTRSDENGHFELPWPEGATSASLMARNNTGQFKAVMVTDPSQPIEIRMREGQKPPGEEQAQEQAEEQAEDDQAAVTVQGTVWDNGAPVAGAQVFIMKYIDGEGEKPLLRPATFEENPDSPYFTRTDGDGHFVLPWVDGALVIRVHARNSEGIMLGKLLKDPAQSADIVLRGQKPPEQPQEQEQPEQAVPDRTLRGRVVSAERTPVEGASVCVWAWRGAGKYFQAESVDDVPEQYRTRSAADGSFELTVPGNATGVKLRVSHPDIYTLYTGAYHSVADGVFYTVPLAVPPPIYISGTVLDAEGKLVEGATACVYTEPLLGGPTRAQTDAEGKFRIDLEERGQRVFTAEKAGIGFFASHVTTLQERGGSYPGHDMVITLRPPGGISGVVTDEATGKPLAGVEVTIKPGYVQRAQADISYTEQAMFVLAESRFKRSTHSDENGHYHLDCDAGQAYLYLDLAGYVFTGSLRGGPVTVPAGQEGQADLAMRRLHGVYFRVQCDEDARVGRTDVDVKTADGSKRYYWMAPAGANWHMAVFVDKPGTVLTLQGTARAHEMVCKPSSVTVGEQPQTVTVHVATP